MKWLITACSILACVIVGEASMTSHAFTQSAAAFPYIGSDAFQYIATHQPPDAGDPWEPDPLNPPEVEPIWPCDWFPGFPEGIGCDGAQIDPNAPNGGYMPGPDLPSWHPDITFGGNDEEYPAYVPVCWEDSPGDMVCV